MRYSGSLRVREWQIEHLNRISGRASPTMIVNRWNDCCMLMTDVLKSLIRESSLLAPDLPSFKRQESTFIALNLFVLAVLLLIHTLFSSYFGTPPRSSIVVLAIGFFLNVIEAIWVQNQRELSPANIVIFTATTIVLNMAVAF